MYYLLMFFMLICNVRRQSMKYKMNKMNKKNVFISYLISPNNALLDKNKNVFIQTSLLTHITHIITTASTNRINSTEAQTNRYY